MDTVEIYRTVPEGNGYYPKPYIIWVNIDGKDTLVQCFTSDYVGFSDINVVVSHAEDGKMVVLI